MMSFRAPLGMTNSGLSGASFSLRGFDLARTKLHTLKRASLKPKDTIAADKPKWFL
jgi:hypothetical protein